jgi:hypothetical protein
MATDKRPHIKTAFQEAQENRELLLKREAHFQQQASQRISSQANPPIPSPYLLAVSNLENSLELAAASLNRTGARASDLHCTCVKASGLLTIIRQATSMGTSTIPMPRPRTNSTAGVEIATDQPPAPSSNELIQGAAEAANILIESRHRLLSDIEDTIDRMMQVKNDLMMVVMTC